MVYRRRRYSHRLQSSPPTVRSAAHARGLAARGWAIPSRCCRYDDSTSLTRAERIPLRLADSHERAASKRRVPGARAPQRPSTRRCPTPEPDTALDGSGYPEVDAGVLFLGSREVTTACGTRFQSSQSPRLASGSRGMRIKASVAVSTPMAADCHTLLAFCARRGWPRISHVKPVPTLAPGPHCARAGAFDSDGAVPVVGSPVRNRMQVVASHRHQVDGKSMWTECRGIPHNRDQKTGTVGHAACIGGRRAMSGGRGASHSDSQAIGSTTRGTTELSAWCAPACHSS